MLKSFKEFISESSETENYKPPIYVIQLAENDSLYYFMEDEYRKAKKTEMHKKINKREIRLTGHTKDYTFRTDDF